MSKPIITTYDAIKVLPQPHGFILRCPYSKCNARIIQPSTIHEVVEITDMELEFIRPSSSEEESIVEDDHQFLKITDVWDFDNIGVSKNFDNKHQIERLIICSDCDRGPLGFAKFDDNDEVKDVKNLRYFVNLSSCVYQNNV